MSDARFLEVERDAESAARHFTMAVRLYEEDVFHGSGFDTYRSEMALIDP